MEYNGYNSDFVSSILKKKSSQSDAQTPEDLVRMFFELLDSNKPHQGFASLPYINGLSQPLSRLLRKHNIQVVNRPFKTLSQEFPSPKFRPDPKLQKDVVYKIPCSNCSWCYIGETGRSFTTRKKEHIRNTKLCAKGSNVAQHAWNNDHKIDFNLAKVIDKGNFRHRKTLESWHTAATKNADNNSKPLPKQYAILIKQ